MIEFSIPTIEIESPLVEAAQQAIQSIVGVAINGLKNLASLPNQALENILTIAEQHPTPALQIQALTSGYDNKTNALISLSAGVAIFSILKASKIDTSFSLIAGGVVALGTSLTLSNIH